MSLFSLNSLKRVVVTSRGSGKKKVKTQISQRCTWSAVYFVRWASKRLLVTIFFLQVPELGFVLNITRLNDCYIHYVNSNSTNSIVFTSPDELEIVTALVYHRSESNHDHFRRWQREWGKEKGTESENRLSDQGACERQAGKRARREFGERV